MAILTWESFVIFGHRSERRIELSCSCVAMSFRQREVIPSFSDAEKACLMSPGDTSASSSPAACVTPSLVCGCLPVWPSPRRPWKPPVACATDGILGRRWNPLKNAAASVCREAGWRVCTNEFIRDLDLAEYNNLDDRMLEVVVDGLLLWRRASWHWTH